MPSIVRNYMAAGLLPNMRRLAEEGAWSEITPVFPTHTAANWNTVSTGAYPSTHGVTDMVVKMPGRPLAEIVSGFYSTLCQAEQIWKTAERHHLKVLLMKYIGSWPPSLTDGFQVEGFGAPGGPGSRPWGSSPLAISNSSCYSTTPLENGTVIAFSPYSGSRGMQIPDGFEARFQTQFTIGPAPGIKCECIAGSADSRNDQKLLLMLESAQGTSSPAALVLSKGQTSGWIVADFISGGKQVQGAFRFTLIDIASSGELPSVRLFVSQVFPTEGWTFPHELAKELVPRFGPFLESISHFPYVFGWIDEDTYLADAKYQSTWMAAATSYLMSKRDWHLYMTQWHGIDNTQHAFLRFDKSVLTQSEAETCDTVMKRTYQLADDFVGHIHRAAQSSAAEKPSKTDGKDEVYTIVMSDHGHVMGKRRFFINGYLYQKGLIHLKRDESTRKISIDWSKTKAFAQGMVHVYVNLKGRDPDGCVSPGKEYEDLVEQLIDMLYDIRDPVSRIRPIALALSNKNAEFIGLNGSRSGDVVVAAYPSFALDNRVTTKDELFEDLKVKFRDASIHGSQLPSVNLGERGTTDAMFIAHGPCIKKGYQRERPLRMIDIAPTISHLLGIDAPRNSEGVPITDILT